MKQKILDTLNKIIISEKGVPVTMNSMFTDSDLDSLGIMLTIVTLESDYPIFKNIAVEDELAYLDIPNLTVRDLIKKCVLSITNTSSELSRGMAT